MSLKVSLASVSIKRKQEIILLISSIALLLINLFISPQIDNSSDLFTYFNNLSLAYWIGLTITILGLFSSYKKNKYIPLLFILLLNSYLFGTALIIYHNIPGSADLYLHSASAESIRNIGNFDNLSDAQKYPGAYVFLAIFAMMIGVDCLSVVRIYQFLVILLISLVAYVLVKRLLPNSWLATISPLIVVSLYWFVGDHFGKESYSLIIYSFFFMIFFFNSKFNTRSSLIAVIIVSFAAIIVHPLTSLVIILTLIVYFIIKNRLRLYFNSYVFLIISILFFWLAWYILYSDFIWGMLYTLNNAYNMLINELFDPLISFQIYSNPYTAIYSAVNYLRMFSTFFVMIVGACISLFFIFKKKLESTHIILLSGLIISLFLFFASTSRLSVAQIYRPLEYAVLPFALLIPIFISKLRHSRKRKMVLSIFLFIIIFLAFALPISKTSIMSRTHLPTTSMKIADFISENFDDISVKSINMPSIAYRYYSYAQVYNNGSYNDYFDSFFASAGETLGLYYYQGNLSSQMLDYKIIATTDQYLTDDNFYIYNPSANTFLQTFLATADHHSSFNKIYSSGPYNNIYVRCDKIGE